MPRTFLETYAAHLAPEMEACWRLQSFVSGDDVRVTYGSNFIELRGSDRAVIDAARADDLHDAIRELHARVSARFEAHTAGRTLPRGSGVAR